ncbi:carbamoyl phosphate synthase [Carbonactinospora thermoautotrophica]|uniref:acetyl/propionyl/methylcrotonyl-CoA carboxylase subunit alpha n=1 Tax=Carbonactinospora thermoautotrophica TaxID=1469144 RepID=UPI0022719213|nr:acetyl-CoA carboxylase biotin carboxylase subunit [Carbonactinospora thermoautotrophica]MCX9192406.1 carbamoyl phosphate synthase [Carbonactinospora thermoautotrophica]
MFSKVLVANRGEIAVRVIRTCAELGIATVAVHSDADREAMHVRVADEAVALGGDLPAESYLDADKILKAAADTGADAVHPGYGFLAENADFARAVDEAGMTFIGPPADAIAAMGEKVAARRVAEEAEVPCVPGTRGAVESVEEILDFGAAHGYPIAVKASYGGGGHGMRLVHNPEQAHDALAAARREAQAAFGRPDVYLERYLAHARHVEVQIFADRHGTVVWLGDRDCSVQRRHQKLVEESPAPELSSRLRRAMGEAAVRVARAVGYLGAGTVEFLVEDDRFYFLEMNTRIQVEHPVTEQVLGLDLVAEQIRVAAGEPLTVQESGPAPRGHAIECRVNAEDPAGGLFLPSPGIITRLTVPHRPGVRFDTGYEAGDEVLPYYDSMIGKLIVWAPDRDTAIRRMLATLEEVRIEGVATTLPASRAVLSHPDFQAVRFTTRWLESAVDLPQALEAAGEAADAAEEETARRDEVWVGGRRYVIPYFGTAQNVGASRPGEPEGRRRRSTWTRGPARRGAGAGSSAAPGAVTSPMQGTVVSVAVSEGDTVSAGDVLFVVEAMKMENPVRATAAGVVTELRAAVGDVVAAGTVLAVLGHTEEASR